MPLTRLDLNNVHWTNIYPRHQWSQGTLRPSPQVPAEEVGPLEGAAGCSGRELGWHWLWTLAGCRGVPCFTGAHRGRGLALRHLLWMTQQETGRRPLPSLHH